jgi:hypothetical protein
LDLGSFFNAPLTPQWVLSLSDTNPEGLPAAPVGVVKLEGIPFEIRGVVQLGGNFSRRRRAGFPDAALGIALPLHCRRIHLLHATDGELPAGEVAGCILVHFADGPPERLDLRYGEHFGALFSANRQLPTSNNSSVMWKNDVTGPSRHQTLYRTTWTNPRPDEKLAMLDYESAMKACGPMLLAVTVEP